MFIFDKVLLTCKSAKGDTYTYKDSIKLSDYRLQDGNVDQEQSESGKFGYSGFYP